MGRGRGDMRRKGRQGEERETGGRGRQGIVQSHRTAPQTAAFAKADLNLGPYTLRPTAQARSTYKPNLLSTQREQLRTLT